MNEALPTPVQWALNRLTSCHYEAFAVGGCVRDMLLGLTPHDWDVCTSATPQEVIDCFANVRVVATGIKHGTVTALLDGQPVEITTFRVDGGYADHRHPDDVRFTANLQEDLARRDFTINAMAYHPDKGLIDFYGGQADLYDGIIRCVGDPEERFAEDALRILRALRFASRFHFAIEPDTSDALLRRCGDLCHVSVERVLAELAAIDWANVDGRYLPVVQVVIPELTAIDVRPGLPAEPEIRLAALLRGLNAGAILRRLKGSKVLIDRVAVLAREMDEQVPPDDVSIRRLLRRLGPETAAQLLILQDNEKALNTLTSVLERGDAYCLAQLDVNGNDMKRIGLDGRAIGWALEGLLTKVIDGELPNERAKLLRAISITATLGGV